MKPSARNKCSIILRIWRAILVNNAFFFAKSARVKALVRSVLRGSFCIMMYRRRRINVLVVVGLGIM